MQDELQLFVRVVVSFYYASAFVTCLRLRRPVYGVVTDIRENDGKKQIEYETWFSSAK
jgi:hypothetical protein